MKILLTGRPGVGKSTISEKVRQKYRGRMYGIVAREIRNEKGQRVGFESVNMEGKTNLFAHKTEIQSDQVVGGSYHVNVKAIDTFVVGELKKGLEDTSSLVFIDEIGRMQSFSQDFLTIVKKILNSDANVLATIVFDPEPWSTPIKNHRDVVLVEVTQSNRDILPELLTMVFNHSQQEIVLSSEQKGVLNMLLRQYFKGSKSTQINKLYLNAIKYILENRIKNLGKNDYEVTGNTQKHRLTLSKEKIKCDCDLFNGKNKYTGRAGICSHLQSVVLSKPPLIGLITD